MTAVLSDFQELKFAEAILRRIAKEASGWIRPSATKGAEEGARAIGAGGENGDLAVDPGSPEDVAEGAAWYLSLLCPGMVIPLAAWPKEGMEPDASDASVGAAASRPASRAVNFVREVNRQHQRIQAVRLRRN